MMFYRCSGPIHGSLVAVVKGGREAEVVVVSAGIQAELLFNLKLS